MNEAQCSLFDQAIATKCCRCCNKQLPLTAFSADRTKKDGLNTQCRTCKSAYKKQYRIFPENRERQRFYAAAYDERHHAAHVAEREARAAIRLNLRNDRLARIAEKRAAKRAELENHEVACINCGQQFQRRVYNQKRCDLCVPKANSDWQKRARSRLRSDPSRLAKFRERRREREKALYQNDVRYNLTQKMSVAVRNRAKGKDRRRLFDILGYSAEDLIKRLTATMPSGYTWQDFMDGKLHIDHVIPVAAFPIQSIEDKAFKLCWGLRNLRLLPAEQNIRKSDSLPY